MRYANIEKKYLLPFVYEGNKQKTECIMEIVP